MVGGPLKRLHNWLKSLIRSIFRRKTEVRLGLYGPTNSGKTTLANRICMDWIGEKMGKVSSIPHETREIQVKEKVTIEKGNKKLVFKLVDTPGIATKIDFEDFVKRGLKKKKAKQRAKEATKGVIEAIKWLDKMDAVLVVLDASKNPIDQVNVTILGNLEARNTPVLIVANKIDLKRANAQKVREAFPKYKVIGISAKKGSGIKNLYNELFELL